MPTGSSGLSRWRVCRLATPLFRSAHHPWVRQMAQRHGRARVSGHWPRPTRRRPPTPLRRRLTAMPTTRSDGADGVCRLTPHACACAHLTGVSSNRVGCVRSAPERTNHDHDHPRPRSGHHHRLGAARQRTATSPAAESFRPQRFEGGGMRFLRFKRWLTELKARERHRTPALRGGASPRLDRRGARLRRFSPRSPRGASTTRSRTRACRSARSRSTPPAKAMRQGR